MGLKLIFSKKFLDSTQDLFFYLESKWSVKVKEEFSSNLQKKLDNLLSHPESCILSSKKEGLRKCVVSKQTSIYYKIDREEIRILALFDNRMNPTKIKKKLL